jgi:hypothetical protein
MHRSRISYLIEVVIHLLFWVGVYYSLKSVTTTSFNVILRVGTGGTQRVDGQLSFPHAWIVLGFLMLLFYSNSLWLFGRVLRYKSAVKRVAVIVAWFLFIFLLNYVVVGWRLGARGKMRFAQRIEVAAPRPPLAPVLSVPPPPFAPDANWQHMQLVMALVFLAVLAIAVAEFFIKEWIRNDMSRSQAEAHQLSMEVRFLRSQVNPHFLFNTLNNLFSMAQKKGNDELADGISKLSGMMRYMIYESNTEKVYLQKEIDYLKHCIALNKLRYADGEVTVRFGHPPPAEISGVQIAPMLFIPFLENAFKHGVSIGHRCAITLGIAVEAVATEAVAVDPFAVDVPDAGALAADAFATEALAFGRKKLIFTCENADHSAVARPEDENSGIGLANVKRHLELVYGGHYTLHTGLEDGKYRVHLQIDLG